MLSPYVFTPLIQKVTICSFFWLDATSKDSWQYVTWQVKAKSNKQKKSCEFAVIWNCIWYYIFARNLIFRDKKIQLALQYLYIHDIHPKMENIWEKNFHEIPKSKTWICHSSSTIYIALTLYLGFPGGLDSKESACSVGDMGSIPGLRRSPGEGNGNPLQYCYLENSMDRHYSPWGCKESDMTEWLSTAHSYLVKECEKHSVDFSFM